MENIENIEIFKNIAACCELWPNCEGHMDIYEENLKEAIEQLLVEVKPVSDDKAPKNGEPTSLINAIMRANGNFS